MEEFDLGLVAAEWEANLLPRERVPELATALLEAGHDTPSLRLAAGLLATELDQAHKLFGQALAELGYKRLRNWRGHGQALALEYARRGVDGRMAVQEAVVAIYNLSLRFDDEDWALHSASLTDFIVLADLWEDRPDERPALERDLREHLQRFLTAGGNPQPPTPL